MRAEDDPPVDCTAAMSTHELNFCAEKELQAADAKLNDIYTRVLAHVAANGSEPPYDGKSWQDALRKSQRAWVAFRDADCKDLVPMAWAGGTATTGQVLGCMAAMTEARANQLKDRYLPE